MSCTEVIIDETTPEDVVTVTIIRDACDLDCS